MLFSQLLRAVGNVYLAGQLLAEIANEPLSLEYELFLILPLLCSLVITGVDFSQLNVAQLYIKSLV